MKQDQKPESQPDKAELMEVAKRDETLFSLQQKADIDTQIATAKAFPRSITQFKRDLLSMATADIEIAEACTYALPPRSGKVITGPSVRFAELVALCWTNIRTGCRVIHIDGRVVVAQGIAHDVERNRYHAEDVERSILQNEYDYSTGKGRKTGRMVKMNEDMQVVTGRAAQKIALRNVILGVVPVALWQDTYAEVKRVAMGDAQTLVERRDKRIGWLVNEGVKEELIYEALGVKGKDDLGLDKLHILQGMISALKNQEATMQELFPTKDQREAAKNASKGVEDKLIKQRGGTGVQEQMESDIKGGKP